MDYIEMTPGLYMFIVVAVVAVSLMTTVFLFTIIKDIVKEWIANLLSGRKKKEPREPRQEKAELSFWQELEDDYYKEFDWEKETHTAVGSEFMAVFEGRIDRVVISSYKGEEATSKYIKRGKRKLWVVGNSYEVTERMYTPSEDKDIGNGMRQFTQSFNYSESIGSIILTKIIPDKFENTLIFKVI